MERVILHCDANAFYASVECLYTPSIRHRPVAVCGSVEERHGIVLTKNQIAKQFGVQTGEAIWQARQKCPDLICVPPDYALYILSLIHIYGLPRTHAPCQVLQPSGADGHVQGGSGHQDRRPAAPAHPGGLSLIHI